MLLVLQIYLLIAVYTYLHDRLNFLVLQVGLRNIISKITYIIWRSRREQGNKDYMTFRIRFFEPVWEFTKALHFTPLTWIKKVSKFLLTLFRMGIFGTAHGWGEGKRSPVPLSKSCNSYPTMMRLGPVIPSLKKIQKIFESRDTHPDFCWYHHFFTGN